MRVIVRYVLMAASLGGLLFVAYIIVVHADSVTSEGWFLVTSMGVGLTINLIYLLTDSNKRTPSRIAKLFGLWLDAKEHELRKRAGREVRGG
jgi:Na+/H+ antiporter NhaA